MARIVRNASRFFHENKRQILTVGAAVFIAYVLLLSGIFSYFHSEDAVANRMEAKSGSATIREPGWDAEGQYKARVSEPGMTIEKDPYGYNDGQTDLYIRLVMTVEASEFNSKNETYDAAYRYGEADRVNAILDSIRLANGDALLNGARDSTQNPDFVMKTKTDSDTGKTTYYFYYTGGDKTGGADMMRVVKPKNGTPELFHQLDIPIYKKDYLGVFDQPYDIVLTAEGVPAANYPDGLPVEDVMDADDNVIAQGAVGVFDD